MGSVIWFIIATELAVIILLFQQINFLPTLHVYLPYLLMSQVTFILFHYGFVTYDFLYAYSNGGFDMRYYDALLLYSIVFYITLIVHLNLPISTSLALKVVVSRKVVATANAIVTPIVIAFFALYSAIVDWNIIWLNETYLAMGTPELVAKGSRFALIVNLLLPIGIICSALLALNLAKGKFGAFALFLVPTLFVELFSIGAHARGAAALPIVFAFVIFTTSGGRYKKVAYCSIVFALATISSALALRGSGEHGLSVAPETLISVLSGEGSGFLDTLLPNLSEGIFTVAESLQVDVQGSVFFKMLNFSPLPGFVDGYNVLRETTEVRLSDFAPISGFVEALKFGWIYVVLLVAFVGVSVRLCFWICRDNGLLKAITNTFILLGLFSLGAYPIRNATKTIWVGVAIAILYWLAKSIQSGRTVRPSYSPSTPGFTIQ